MNGVTVQLLGSAPTSTLTDVNGQYAFAGIGSGTWQIQPLKQHDQGAGISTLDAVYILQALAGTLTLTPEQQLACDVTGNGTLSTLDAVRILQFKVGSITSFDVALSCGSDWAFIPVPAPTPNQLLSVPQMTTGTCQAGSITLQPLAGQAGNQDFTAVLFGDCTGNWQPSISAAIARRAGPAVVSVGHARHRGAQVLVPLVVEGSRTFSALDLEVAYNPRHLKFRGVHRIGSASQALLAAHERQPGRVAISLASAEPVPAGTIAALLFENDGGHFDARAISVVNAEMASP